MTKPLPKTRKELQAEAMHLDGLLNVAIGYDMAHDDDKLICLLTMAADHAKRLNAALDSVNKPEVGA
ncbi:MAG: hypothetical protein AAF755_00145 [Pseudomonadota bacterium]